MVAGRRLEAETLDKEEGTQRVDALIIIIVVVIAVVVVANAPESVSLVVEAEDLLSLDYRCCSGWSRSRVLVPLDSSQ